MAASTMKVRGQRSRRDREEGEEEGSRSVDTRGLDCLKSDGLSTGPLLNLSCLLSAAFLKHILSV